MILSRKIVKYELINLSRNVWLLGYSLLLTLLGCSLIWIGGSFQKAITTLSQITVVLVPLVALIYSVVSWYYNERFTELMLTQAIQRSRYFLVRYYVLSHVLGLCTFIGLTLPFFFFGGLSPGVWVLGGISFGLTLIFVALGLGIAIATTDRMKGVGLTLGIWCLFEIVYDGILLFFLVRFKEYPLDVASGLLGSLNPVGLARVVLLMFNDSSLLLGYSGIIIRNLLTTPLGYFIAASIAGVWLVVPLICAIRYFNAVELNIE